MLKHYSQAKLTKVETIKKAKNKNKSALRLIKNQ